MKAMAVTMTRAPTPVWHDPNPIVIGSIAPFSTRKQDINTYPWGSFAADEHVSSALRNRREQQQKGPDCHARAAIGIVMPSRMQAAPVSRAECNFRRVRSSWWHHKRARRNRQLTGAACGCCMAAIPKDPLRRCSIMVILDASRQRNANPG